MTQTLEEAIPEIWEVLALARQNKPPTFRHFFEEAVYITDAHKGLIKVEPWPHLLEMADAWGRGDSEVTLKARQLGVSYLLAAFVVWRGQYFGGSRTFVFSQGKDESYEVMTRAQDIYDNQPKGWAIPLKTRQKGLLTWEGGGTATAYASTSKKGRGLTGTVILDEAATHPNAEEHYAALRPVLSGGGQFICVSTAQGASGWFHDMYKASRAGQTPYTARFVPWDSRPDRDHEWLIRERKAFALHPALFRQEFPANDEEAFVAFSGMVFGMNEDGEEIFSRTANIKLPPCNWEDYRFRIAGIDPGGRDPSAIIFLGVTRDERLHAHFEWVTQRNEPVGIDQLAAQLWKIGSRAPINLVVTDASSRITIESLARLGFPSYPASRDRDARINHLITLFRTRSLTVSPWCKQLVEQLFQIYWKERDEQGGGGKSGMATVVRGKSHGDAPDALGYAVMGAFRGIEWRTSDNQEIGEQKPVSIRFK